MAKPVKYYVSGHTAAGYVNYVTDNLQGIDNVIVLKCHHEPALTPIFENLAETLEKRDILVELISGLICKHMLIGIIVREMNTAILASSIVQDPIPGAVYLDLTKYEQQTVKPYHKKQEEKIINTVYGYFEKGLAYHDKLEEIYVKEMSFDKADEVAATFIQQLLKDVEKKQREPVEFIRLFGTNIPEGKVNHVKELIAPMQHVYYIKGRAGTGKSVFMKKVLQSCKHYGYDVEVYRCSFDPESVDMVIVRELDFCIFDSTPPHEFYPDNNEAGEIIDLYKRTVTPGTDEHYQDAINQWTAVYQAEMKKGMETLQQLQAVYGEPVMNLQIEPVLKELNTYLK